MFDFFNSEQVAKNLSLLTAGVIGLITVLYKFLRIIKFDQRNDGFDKEEQDFRIMLLNEMKELRESNKNLLIEKGELLSRISSLEVELEWLRKHILKLEEAHRET